MSTHDWHLADAERGYEVRRTEHGYEVRHIDRPDEITELTAEEFDQWRREGPNPKGLR